MWVIARVTWPKSRLAVLSDLGRVPQMPLDAMMQMLIPPLLSEEEVEAS